jgi:large subunit ribosomal protein L4
MESTPAAAKAAKKVRAPKAAAKAPAATAVTKAPAATKADARVLAGGRVSTREIDLTPYGTSRRSRLLKQVVVAYQANARQGTHKTKGRSETSYSGAKPWPQKHTGRARAGDRNSPLWRHGGVIHAKRPREYRHNTPRRMLREALRSALYGKFVDGEVAFLEGLALDQPSTKSAAKWLKDLGATRGATIVLAKDGETLWRSFRNIDRCEVVPACEVNALHVLRRTLLVFVGDALGEVEQRLAAKPAAASA